MCLRSAYNITISNESDQIVQLKNRHWIITDQNGNKEEVRGPGVVGQQPVLLPGKKFSYNRQVVGPPATSVQSPRYCSCSAVLTTQSKAICACSRLQHSCACVCVMLLCVCSGCPLPTECGTMEGTYEFMVLDEKDGLFKEPFSVTIARFKLTTQVRLSRQPRVLTHVSSAVSGISSCTAVRSLHCCMGFMKTVAATVAVGECAHVAYCDQSPGKRRQGSITLPGQQCEVMQHIPGSASRVARVYHVFLRAG